MLSQTILKNLVEGSDNLERVANLLRSAHLDVWTEQVEEAVKILEDQIALDAELVELGL